MNTSHELSNTEKSESTANRVLALAKKTSAEIAVLATLATGLGACGSETESGEAKEPLSPETQVAQIVDNYIKDPENNPLPEGVEIVEVTIKDGDGSQSAGERVIAEQRKSGNFSSADANNARSASAATSINLSRSIEGDGKGTMHPGDTAYVAVGRINSDELIDVANLRLERKAED